jgi:anti-anti-sigma factor
MGGCPPPLTPAVPAGVGSPSVPVDTRAVQSANHLNLERLSAVLDGRQLFHRAQGMLAETAGCTMRRAGQVLLQRGAQLGLQTAAGVAGYFLINAANASGDPHSRAAIARFAALAAGSDPDHVDTRATPPFATLIATGRTLKIRGELDIATAPLLAAAFADRSPANRRGSSFFLELSDLTFLDVAGLRALAAIETQISNDGERLQVDLPTSSATKWMLRFAVTHDWISAVFTGTANGIWSAPRRVAGHERAVHVPAEPAHRIGALA